MSSEESYSLYMMRFSIFIYFVIIVQLVSALKGSYDAISCFPFSLECYKLFVLR